MELCSTKNCKRKMKAKGLCINCYNKKRYKENKEKEMNKTAYGTNSGRPRRIEEIAKSMGISTEKLKEIYETRGRI